MKHRERVLTALDHRQPDRCPMQISFTPEFAARLETIGRGGGLIIGPTHHVQLDTPLENFWALVEAIQN
jgi:hypothetical protein